MHIYHCQPGSDPVICRPVSVKADRPNKVLERVLISLLQISPSMSSDRHHPSVSLGIWIQQGLLAVQMHGIGFSEGSRDAFFLLCLARKL
ncbi:hypothetical protein Y032_0365g3572 [Ancylostoma ceylanicum]|uniref:Uncharacterized protein n=1 Tax=Ancylostoma ceylanicum TaxID=53326 RepID=A0A016RVM9_9BILA|nr:hypothetical protein Y032_0365g3572 [Ancylostoma ceylanicum]